MQIVTHIDNTSNNQESLQKQFSAKYDDFDDIFLDGDRIVTNCFNDLRDLCVYPAVKSCLKENERIIIVYSCGVLDPFWSRLMQMIYSYLELNINDNFNIDINRFGEKTHEELQINNSQELKTVIKEWIKADDPLFVIQLKIILPDGVKTLKLINVFVDETIDSRDKIFRQINHSTIKIRDIVALKYENTTVVLNIGNNDLYWPLQFVKQLVELKKDTRSVKGPNEGDVDQVFKLKYDSALQKMIDLETKLEVLRITGDEIIDLRAENSKLKQQLSLYQEMLRCERNGFDMSITAEIEGHITKKNTTLESDAIIYKKLLVSKTDRILQLEYEIEQLSQEKINLTNQNTSESMKEGDAGSCGRENVGIYGEMQNNLFALTETIQTQNVHLQKEVERAEADLLQKESLLKETSKIWMQRNISVAKEQNEVEMKLAGMGNRFKNIVRSADNKVKQSSASIKSPPLKLPTSSTFGGTNDTDSENKRRGPNFNIIKPF